MKYLWICVTAVFACSVPAENKSRPTHLDSLSFPYSNVKLLSNEMHSELKLSVADYDRWTRKIDTRDFDFVCTLITRMPSVNNINLIAVQLRFLDLNQIYLLTVDDNMNHIDHLPVTNGDGNGWDDKFYVGIPEKDGTTTMEGDLMTTRVLSDSTFLRTTIHDRVFHPGLSDQKVTTDSITEFVAINKHGNFKITLLDSTRLYKIKNNSILGVWTDGAAFQHASFLVTDSLFVYPEMAPASYERKGDSIILYLDGDTLRMKFYRTDRDTLIVDSRYGRNKYWTFPH
ncbi:MAG TPA: hypothetical protein VFE50_24290 [Cyclobacteriaceae bacterium]|nr:hypothetical protein [Cyclobacteriaceae bacterium]